MLIELFQNSIEPWVWFASGLVLIGLELAVPGSFLIWFGAAALVVGALVAYFDMDWRWQLVLWGVLSVSFLLIGRRLTVKDDDKEGDPHLNKRGSRYQGRVFVLKQALAHGKGTLEIGDSIWRVNGPDLPAGAHVKVVGQDGTTLIVEAASEGEEA
ncbi:Inner membrane protein YbbJ [Pseudovibrio sp. W64]|uniref:NfeD-like C-terminal domain-containing protein n=1 Tax=Pseudovibrio ascidiaceicola TaxID=285279 RepID=A0A1I4AE39_9HYPH|nr:MULTISPECIES: NfeD family protein [Pseudovibrio]KZK79889.1 Inner membrane protein YbbJ [Pseudovibrio sp. Ad13]KZK83917.1 Inner membrane protein YbbJ [Pseudovibrio sp. W64]KZK93076.1 Inner membrane protein YbbJ [Pseudovibrio sp. W74]KZL04350.1 Inner membrane protein YbbJ [Pseudovibrio sp. Ad14]KZL13522.1 Inner membrane protein YbbJ [Pseudovibrio sp. Ad37]